jgi:hypothetical protein
MKTRLKKAGINGHAPPGVIAVRQDGPYVVVFIDGRGIQFLTTDIHKVGYDMVVKSSQALPGDSVVMEINGVDIDLPPKQATQVGGALLRKADFADDWQLHHGRRAAQ